MLFVIEHEGTADDAGAPFFQDIAGLVGKMFRLMIVFPRVVLGERHIGSVLLQSVCAKRRQRLYKEDVVIRGVDRLYDLLVDLLLLSVVHGKSDDHLEALGVGESLHLLYSSSKIRIAGPLDDIPPCDGGRQTEARRSKQGSIRIGDQRRSLGLFRDLIDQFLDPLIWTRPSIGYAVFCLSSADRLREQDAFVDQAFCNSGSFSFAPIGSGKRKVYRLFVRSKKFIPAYAQRDGLQEQDRPKNALFIRREPIRLEHLIALQHPADIVVHAVLPFAIEEVPQKVYRQKVRLIIRSIAVDEPFKALGVGHVVADDEIEHAALVGREEHSDLFQD